MPTRLAYQGASVSNFFALQLEGQHCCWVHRSFGGGIYAEVVSEPGSEHHLEKQIGSPRYEDVVLDLGFPLDHKIGAWISSSWKMEHRRLNGSIIAFDGEQALTERKFAHAVLGATTLPDLDAASPTLGFLRVHLSPERSELHRRPKVQMPPADPIAQMPFQVSNFKLTIEGLDCEDVVKIDSFTVRQAVHRHAVGEHPGIHQLEPGRVEVPKLILTLADRKSADGWYAWLKSFVVEGKNGVKEMKKGMLALLPTDERLKGVQINLINLGLSRMTEPESGDQEQFHSIRVELYCERMEFVVPA